MSFKTTLSEAEQANLITGELLKKVEDLLRGHHQTEALSLVMKDKGVTIVDALGPVNTIYRRVDPSFMSDETR
jgi:hypothetical protein